jgi:hypothetical protein
MLENDEYLQGKNVLLNEDIMNELEKFNSEYNLIFHLPTQPPKSYYHDKILPLDKKGWELKIRIEKDYGYKVKYYSRGLSAFLLTEPRSKTFQTADPTYFQRIVNMLLQIFYS